MNFVEEMLNRLLEYLQDEEWSQVTIDKYARGVRRFPDCLGEDGIVDREKVRVYKQELRKHYKIIGANSMLATINSSFAFTGCGDLKVKLLKVQKMLFCSLEKEMTQKDYERLIQEAREEKDIRMSMPPQTTGSTEVRISESKYITVEALDTDHARIHNKGKSWVVLVPSKLERLLRKYRRKVGIVSGGIFVTRHGSPMDRSNINKRMKWLGEVAGVALMKVFPYSLHHLFARSFYKVEKDVVRPTDLLGHSDINTTRIYTVSTEDQSGQQMVRVKMVLG